MFKVRLEDADYTRLDLELKESGVHGENMERTWSLLGRIYHYNVIPKHRRANSLDQISEMDHQVLSSSRSLYPVCAADSPALQRRRSLDGVRCVLPTLHYSTS